MAGFLTSYVGLFTPNESETVVTSVEIPLIQRDYAQGRRDAQADDIRERFLDVLHDALVNGQDVGLDFIYGDVDEGTLRPLDGQQRLTTLFLLHWYLAYRAGQLGDPQPWTRFSYATRPTARRFCEQLVTAQPPADEQDPAAWIVDQPWYLYVWQNDPTVQAMLVMIAAIHSRFADCDPDSAWQRLVDEDAPAISFHVLPIDDMGAGEELYIKMNSRGKPLTPFENFKARFERAIEWAGDRATKFDHRIDGTWSDTLWRLRGSDDVVDDEFLRYFAFVTDICQWRAGQLPRSDRLETRALGLFGTAGPEAETSLDFLFHAFDTWTGADVADEFEQLFVTDRAALAEHPDRLLLFGTESSSDLFESCCRTYGTPRFTYGRTLLLFAVLLDRAAPSVDFPRRLRAIRNLIEASESELRPGRLPALVADVERVVRDGSLDVINGFNRAQAEDEQAKANFLAAHPDLASDLFRLEDHPLLRGSLQAFDLDPITFTQRARAFASVMAAPDSWRDLTGALLAAGNYARRRNDRDLQFGSPSNTEPWRRLLTGASRSSLRPVASAFGEVLDAVSAGEQPRAATREMAEEFVAARQAAGHYDWRYYLVRYAAMRAGGSGIYASVGGNMGYLVCMLEKTQMNGRYRDPYLTALAGETGTGTGLSEGKDGPVFTGGHVEDIRWLRLARSGAALRCTEDGWAVRRPENEDFRDLFEATRAKLGIDARLKFVVPQEVVEGARVDSIDRIRAGAELVRALVAAGL